MKSLFVLCILVMLQASVSLAQSPVSKKLQMASAHLDKKEFAEALTIYRQLYAEVNRTEEEYSDLVFGYSASVYMLLMETRISMDWAAILSLSKEFLNILDRDGEFLNSNAQVERYWMYQDLIMAYFGLGDPLLARPYQDALYKAFHQQNLPDGVDISYNFERFVWKDYNIWAYEFYEDPQSPNSYPKNAFYVYRRSKKGENLDKLYSIQAIPSVGGMNQVTHYVFAWQEFGDKKREVLEKYVITLPVNYSELHQSVLKILEEKIGG